MLTQSEIDAIKSKAEIHVEWKFNGGVSPTTEKHCLESYIAGATEERQRAKVLLDGMEKILKHEPIGGFDNGYHALKNIVRDTLTDYLQHL